MPHVARTRSSWARRLVATAIAVVLAGCVTPEEGGQRQAEGRDDGVQLTGQLDGTRIAVSDGGPETRIGDCDPGDGIDDDVCWTVRTIDGVTFTVVFENPVVFVVGETVPVRTDACRTDCDEVLDHAVVDVRVDGETERANGGRLEITGSGPRYGAEFTLRFPSGDRLDGVFDVRQLAPGER